MHLEFDKDGYVCCILYGCTTGSCAEYTGLVPTEPEEYTDIDDWADRAQVQAYYLDSKGDLAYDAARAAALPAEDEIVLTPYTSEQVKSLGIFDAIYPVGSLYMSMNDVRPDILFGGAWEEIQDKFLLASGWMYDAGETGGSIYHEHIAPIGYDSSTKRLGTLNINDTTTEFDSVGGYNAITRDAGGTSIPSGYAAYYTERVSHMPPYLVVNVWKRIA